MRRSWITAAATLQLSPIPDCAILLTSQIHGSNAIMQHTAGIASTAVPQRLPAPRSRFDSFSIILTLTTGGSVQHRLSAVHEHNG